MASSPKKNRVSRKAAFLAAFSITGRLANAARAAKIERDMHYRWMQNDPDYPEAFAAAKAKAAQSWEDEAIRRAVEGVYEPNIHKGEFVYPLLGYAKKVDPETGESKTDFDQPIFGKKPLGVMKHSDRLLEFLLRGNKPDTYRERGSVEVTGAGGGPIEIVERLNAGRKRLAKPIVETTEPGS
jgi:hypothetical protein